MGKCSVPRLHDAREGQTISYFPVRSLIVTDGGDAMATILLVRSEQNITLVLLRVELPEILIFNVKVGRNRRPQKPVRERSLDHHPKPRGNAFNGSILSRVGTLLAVHRIRSVVPVCNT